MSIEEAASSLKLFIAKRRKKQENEPSAETVNCYKQNQPEEGERRGLGGGDPTGTGPEAEDNHPNIPWKGRP